MAEAQEEEEEADEKKQEEEEEQQTLKKSSSSSFLWRGLRLGKRAAIASVAIALAPAVIPTIIVGIAFAFPFGVYLAGIAFTDRVMRSLLSTSSSEIGIWEIEKEKGGFLRKETGAEERVIGEGVVHCDDEDPRNQERVDRDEPTLVIAEHQIDMCPPSTHLDIPTDEGDNFGGIGIGEERHAEEVTDEELYYCDPEQATNIKLKHASSTDNKEDIIGDIGMEEEERKMQAERGVEDNQERGERDEKDKQNTNEELKIWSSDDSSNDNNYVARGCVDAKGGDKPFEVTAKGEKEVTREELEIQGLATAVPEVKQYPMNSYPFTVAMPKGTNNETDQTILRSNCPASTEKGGRTRVEDVQQPQKMLERRSRGPEDTVQDANEERVNGKEGVVPKQSSYVFESVVKQPAPEQNWNEEGVETIGLTLASGIAKEAVLIENCAEDGRSTPAPNIENIRVWHSFVSKAPLECEKQMAPLNLSKEYVSPFADRPSEVTDVESGPPPTVVETAGVVHFNDEVPRGQDEVERGEPAPVPAETEIEISPLTINLNMPSEESENLGEKRISKERCMEEVRGRELNYSDTEQATKIKLEFASSIGNYDITPDLAAVEEKRQMQAESGADKSEDREEIEKIEDEKVNEEQKVGSLDYSLNLNDYMQRGCVNAVGAGIVIELSGNGAVGKKKAEEEMEIQGLTTAVPVAKHHPKTTSPFAAVMPDNGTEQRDLNSTSSSVAEKGNESRTQEVKQPETMLDGRVVRIEVEVHDLPTAAIETKELFPTVHHSLAAVPEERQIDFELASLSSDHACSAAINEEVEGKTVKEANEEKVIGQESMEPTERNYVITSVVSVECKSMVEQNLNDTNAEDGSCDATYNIEDGSVYHSFAAAVPLERESEMASSSLSTEYASAVEDHSSYMADAESGPSVTVVETAGMVHFHDEVSSNEETIWEQIYALRTIVGHKAALHSSLVEELKVLYFVTGIEPPVSLNYTSDIMEISDKLKFLKSVVGVE